MTLNIRLYRDEDHDAIIELSLLAWKPVFRSFEQVLGQNVYGIKERMARLQNSGSMGQLTALPQEVSHLCPT